MAEISSGHLHFQSHVHHIDICLRLTWIRLSTSFDAVTLSEMRKKEFNIYKMAEYDIPYFTIYRNTSDGIT